ncbi:MAG: hypothetical protein QW491_13130 [Thermoproteota archaeon]|nr:hypothetical protein [Candidatus Brockarchaeota archaeon]
MHSRIFSRREREILETWLRGERVEPIEIAKILYRFRRFRELPGDVDLYLRVSRKAKLMKTAST